ncbi:MAG: flippase-like domain-containing protein [Bacteroidota bacterium]|nr:flippase-like domain-containing protein [Bacteroidota bacterium]
MNPKFRKALQFIIFFGLGIGLMYWQFSKFNETEKANFFTALRTADYRWFALAVFVGALSHLSRAIRWQQLLIPLGKRAGLGNRFYAVMVGYLANYGLPRSGEVIRSGLLKNTDDVPFSEAFGTVVVERIVDSLCLLLVFFCVLVFQFSQLQKLWLEYIWNPAQLKIAAFSDNSSAMIIFFTCGLVFFLAMFMLRKKIRNFFSGKLGAFFKGFKEGILGIRKVPKPGWFIFHSLFIWTGYLLALYLCFNCFPLTSGMSLNDALAILLFGTFGVVFTPGGIGLYQVIVTGIIAILLNLEEGSQAAASYAWLSWGSQVATVIIFFGVAVIFKSTLNRISK